MPTIDIGVPLKVDIRLYRGDSGMFRVTVVDADEAPIDVSAATWLCQMRKAPDDVTPIVELAVTQVSGDPAAVDVELTPEQSSLINEDGLWDLQMTLDGEVSTLLAGTVKLTKDVSRPAV